MTGSTWMDVAIAVLFVAVFAWWIAYQLRSWRRTRRILDYTIDAAKREAEDGASPASLAAPPDGSAAKKAPGPWNRT